MHMILPRASLALSRRGSGAAESTNLPTILAEGRQHQVDPLRDEWASSGGPTASQVHELTRAVCQSNLEALLQLQHTLGIDTLRSWRDFNGRGLVHFAAFYSNPISLSGLRRQGYDLHGTTNTGDNAVHIACYQNSMECLKLLHNWGVSLVAANYNGDRPAHKAALRCSSEALAYLHNSGVDIASPLNGQGLTPLDIARESGSWDTVKLLEAAERSAMEDARLGIEEGDASSSLAGLHVPGFYKVTENWGEVMPAAPGTPANRSIRTRESTRGRQDRADEEDQANKRLYLRAKSREDSRRALRKIVTVMDSKEGGLGLE